MAESLLISITDIATYREVDPKIRTAKFEAFAQEAQRKYLRGLFGQAFYYDFFENISDTNYQTLLTGIEYTLEGETVQYYGLKPVLCHWWLSIAAREGDLFLSNHGAIQFTNNPQQAFETAKEKERTAVHYLSIAQDYANDVIKFLNNNLTDYPKWVGDTEKNSAQFISFRL